MNLTLVVREDLFVLIRTVLALLLAAIVISCSGLTDAVNNPPTTTFNYEPPFASYSGGDGTGTLGGAWRLSLDSATDGLIAAETFDLIAQGFSNGSALGFIP